MEVKTLRGPAFELNLIGAHMFSTNLNHGVPLYWKAARLRALRLYRFWLRLGSPKLGK
jgi:hypothetical protein